MGSPENALPSRPPSASSAEKWRCEVLEHHAGRRPLDERRVGERAVAAALRAIRVELEALVLERVDELVGDRDLVEHRVGGRAVVDDPQAPRARVVVAGHLLAEHRALDLAQVGALREQARGRRRAPRRPGGARAGSRGRGPPGPRGAPAPGSPAAARGARGSAGRAAPPRARRSWPPARSCPAARPPSGSVRKPMGTRIASSTAMIASGVRTRRSLGSRQGSGSCSAVSTIRSTTSPAGGPTTGTGSVTSLTCSPT